MYNLLLAFAAALLVAVVLTLTPLTVWQALLPALLVWGGGFFLLARRTNKQVEALFLKSVKELESARPELAIATLKSAYVFEKWQFLIRSQVDAQIGSILFMQKKFDDAEPYLARAFIRHWVAQGMLACCHFRRHKLDDARRVLEKAVAASPKEPLLWGLYAFLLDKANKKDEALKVLQRGVEATRGNNKVKDNLLHLQNHRKLDMSVFGDMWFQFHQEAPPAARIREMQAQWSRMQRGSRGAAPA